MATTTDSREQCPPPSVWDEIASGLMRGDDALTALEHASRCSECAQALRSSIEVFAPGTPAPVPIPIRARARPPVLRWAAIAAALLLVAGVGELYRRHVGASSPMAMLARAYTAQRTVDLRLPGAAYGPLRVERGGRPEPSTEAIAAELAFRLALKRRPNDPAALHAKGRWAILYGRPDDAIQALEAARDAGPATPDANLLTELAMAYCQRGRLNGQTADRLHAVEILGQALKIDPHNTAALFNRAVAEGELDLLSRAIADLEKLLSIEATGRWSSETRAKLAELRQKHSLFFDRRPGENAATFDEVALDDAVCALDSGDSRRLAGRLRAVHRDKWLEELLSLSGTAAEQEAEAVLCRMARIRVSVDSALYTREKVPFARLYQLALPRPLKAWRDFEALYRATHARGEFQCSALSGSAPSQAALDSYPWLAVQVYRERGFCASQAGDTDAAERWARRSIRLADASAYPVSSVRSAGLMAGIGWHRGMYRSTIALASAELDLVFTRRLPVARSHEFLNMLMSSAEDLGWWHAARAAAFAMTESAQVAGFEELRFTNMVRLAQLSLRCGDRGQARSLFREAMDYYARSAQRPANRAWAEIGFADAGGDESSLRPFEGELDQSPDPMIWVPYRRVRAQIALDGRRWAEAQGHLDRVWQWMTSPEASNPHRSKQWLAECRKVAELSLTLKLAQGRRKDAFQFLQQWKRGEEAGLRNTLDVADVWEPSALRLAIAGVGDRLAVWRSDGAELDFRWASQSRTQVEQLARRLTRALETPDSSIGDIGSLARQIGDVLFGSWLSQIAPGRPVIIQTDDCVENLPFAVLPARSEFLGLGHPLSVTSLAFNEGRCTSPHAAARRELLLVDASAAGSSWTPDLPPLASAAREIADIRNAATLPVTVLSAATLSPSAIAAYSAQARVLHFAGHAIETGSGVGLILADGSGPVLLRQLRSAGFRSPPTVVLSACSTGKRTLEDAGGPNSLAAEFLFEGSAEVIASLWDVDSEATALFMTEFYREFGHTGDTSRALQFAMGCLARSPEYSHPYYWATFARFVRA